MKQNRPNAFVPQKDAPPPEMLPQEHVLDNGLRVITLSTPGYRTARASITFSAGSAKDPKDCSGTAHFLEHMILNGSLMHPSKRDRDWQLSQWGGDFNAHTFREKTSYFMQKPVLAEYLDEACGMLLDAVQHPRISKNDIESERGVVATEMSMIQSSVPHVVYNNTSAAYYPETPYADAPIGTAESLKCLDTNTLRQFWDEHYIPSNATICVQGPGTDEELLAMVKKHLTLLALDEKPKARPDSKPQLVPGTRHTVRNDFSFANCTIAWPGFEKQPKSGQKEWMALLLLRNMAQNAVQNVLREEGMVYDATVSMDFYNPISVQFTTDKDPKIVTQKVMEILSSLGNIISDDVVSAVSRSMRIADIQAYEDKLNVALMRQQMAVENQLIYTEEGGNQLYKLTTADDVKELAARIFNKPCTYAVVGSETLLATAPTSAEIDAMYTGPRSEGPVIGWASPTGAHAYDPKDHGRSRA